jgi:hypothetical protein
MKLEYLKTQLLLKGSSGIGDIFFDDPRIVAKDQVKSYPYIIWDMKSYKSTLQWQNTAQEKEIVKGFKAYIIGSYDRRGATNTQTIEQKWDTLREYFRAYLTVLNATSYIKIDNLNDMPNELFDIGLSPDSEIGVSFDCDMTLFCNTAVPVV